MIDDYSREWIAEALENEWGREAWLPEHGLKLAAMIRADGERVKALEAALRDLLASAAAERVARELLKEPGNA